jgi:hypothetical protein
MAPVQSFPSEVCGLGATERRPAESARRTLNHVPIDSKLPGVGRGHLIPIVFTEELRGVHRDGMDAQRPRPGGLAVRTNGEDSEGGLVQSGNFVPAQVTQRDSPAVSRREHECLVHLVFEPPFERLILRVVEG